MKLIIRGVAYLRAISSATGHHSLPLTAISKYNAFEKVIDRSEEVVHLANRMASYLVFKQLAKFYRNFFSYKSLVKRRFFYDTKLLFILKYIVVFFKRSSYLLTNLSFLSSSDIYREFNLPALLNLAGYTVSTDILQFAPYNWRTLPVITFLHRSNYETVKFLRFAPAYSQSYD